ncbi:MAG: MGMT family protein [Halopseudomonas sp.]
MTNPTSKAQQVWQALGQIPAGKVVSYGQLAELAGLPGYARFAGTTLKQLPQATSLPWHRVVNTAGRISFPENSPKFLEQKQRLLAEGVLFVNNRIRMQQYRWQP